MPTAVFVPSVLVLTVRAAMRLVESRIKDVTTNHTRRLFDSAGHRAYAITNPVPASQITNPASMCHPTKTALQTATIANTTAQIIDRRFHASPAANATGNKT
jgi:hypothetical protein